jgi:putative transposase
VPLPGLVHHSDRGSQYASRDYIELLKANQIRISMSRPGQSLGQRGLRILHENAEV